ncbi:pyridoxal phosphate-dependent aminotransferase [Collinsella aerofaciens]|jgi:aminotransferase|uniref:pyridoxal phosphate-dependent aminotransferase n=1 Tax=Collinsella aerofaciens TaxID=74426 RepID=UPI000E963507|nr:aminotransferase class I/II-fold pyridoxal phosphate-dependent enzyme [Collinsella aerofaciens]MZH76000.1 aminotransferase class I/II-fold pyridoxal phosphate-dependent enzyme [Collinsella aerofaciens]MZI14050.1 aminotransferase class I/II-fold pyridoxal phosphate-dependent enzyme [Collinsella aerofaciens]MZJ46993.1 aminotransferase class I/II-fold pyridoxal phosphate-dependent enzyme [Collinsella aerofaciens]MZJ49304.1 aminotransferase class I/II-fold pyridoxal phosphate-dependent enzyme [C
MKELSNRTATFTDSVIRRMTRISNKYGAVNLSQGFPDFDPPAQLLNSLGIIATDPKPLYHQYSITWGSLAMREALAAKQEHFMGMPINPNENIVITCGSTEAMMAAMMTVTNPGDKVVIFSPFYENYGADTILSGAEPIYVPLNPPAFDFDREVLEAAFRDNDPKAIVLCNPSNPCGKVFTREELTFIADLCKQYDAYCITDEVYEHIVYAPHEHVYMATLPGMFERTISCSSLSKTYSITGWRLGYTIAPAQITERIKKVHDFLTVGAAAPLQEAVVTALNFDDSYYDEVLNLYTAKRDLFCQGLDSIGLEHNVPQGAYYVMMDISEFGYDSDLEFCEDLASKVGVGAVPGSSFFREPVNHLIRFHFAKRDETLNAALENLKSLRDKIKPRG